MDYEYFYNKIDLSDYDKLNFACKEGKIDLVKYYLSKGDYINGCNLMRNIWELPLFSAIYSDNNELVEFLLLEGADPNKIEFSETQSFTPLHLAVKVRESRKEEEDDIEIINLPLKIDIIQLLLDFGANINIYNKDGYTPLDFSIIYENPLAKNFLITKGAKFSKRVTNDSWATYLFSKDDFEKVGFIETEYIPEEKFNFIQSNLEYNMRMFKRWDHKLIIDNDIIKYVENGGDINEKNNYGKTPLDYAIEIGHTVGVEYLKSIGAKTSSEL
ncbi:MAG: ankyrin repeat domain-containing protein [Candidatus Sericytochromatia bacterium]